MKENLRITLKIADRSYPMNIHPSEEESYRKAAEEINKLVHLFEENYAIKDRQDALAMCSISFASRLMNISINKQNDQQQTQKQIERLHQILDSMLQGIKF